MRDSSIDQHRVARRQIERGAIAGMYRHLPVSSQICSRAGG
jgi:hypothetical protein